MKTLLLRSALIFCLLFLGLKNAEARVTYGNLTNPGDLPVNTIYSGQTAVAVAGLNISSSRGSDPTTTVSSITFTVNVTPTVLAASYTTSTIRLVSSADPYTPGTFTNSGVTAMIAASGTTSSTITFSGLTGAFAQTLGGGTTYYYLIVDYVANAAGTVNFTTTAFNSGGNINTGFGANTFTLKTSTLTQAQDNAGLATTTLTANQTTIGVYGMSLTSTGKSTFTAINFNTASTPTVNINAYFTSVTLYSSSSATFDGTASAVTGASYSTLAATTLAVTGLNETINDGVTKYYYLVVNYVEPATNGTFQFAVNTITGGTATTTTPTYGTKTGPTYNIKAPTLTGASITAGLAPTTLSLSQNTIAVYGISLKATGNASFSGLSFTTTSTPSVSVGTYFSSVTLYSSSSATFDGTAAPVSGAVYGALTGTTLGITGLTETINDGVTKYYYLVVNYTEPTTTSGTFAFNTPTVTGSATTGTAAGQTYNLKAPSLAEAPITAGLAPTSQSVNQNGIAIYGISLKATGNNTFSALNFTTTTAPAANISAYFTSVQLYSSSNATFDGTATAVSGASYSTLAANTLSVTGLSETINDGATKYYYLVVNYVEPSTTGTFAFNSPTATGATTTGAAAGQTYTLNAATLAETAITAGLAPTTLTASQNNIAVFGMSLKATGNNSFSAINFSTTSTAPAGSNISAYFSSVQLYSSSSATFDGTATPVSGATYSDINATTLSVTGLTETINDGATKYYYLVVNYVEPASTGTFKFTVSSITGATTTGAAAGQVYTLTAPSLAEAPITAGLASTTLTASQNNIAVFGMSLKATGNATFSGVNFTTTSAPAANINAYFSSVQLYSSANATFDGTATAVSGATYSTLNATTLGVTGLSEAINDGTTRYYYLVVNYVEPNTTGTFKFTVSSISTVTTTGAAAGQTYTLTAPSLTQAQITAGLATSPLTVSQTGIAVYGMSLKAVGTASVTALKFTTTSTAPANTNISTYFPSVQLYSSTSNTFNASATPVSGAVYSTLAATTLNITGLTETINDGVTKYYYLVVNYTQPLTSATYQFSLSTVTGSATTIGGANGINYTITAPTLTENQTTGGLYTPTTITNSQTNIPLSGISLVSANGTSTVTSINYTATQNISTYFSGNVNLYKSASATFSTGTATLVTSTAVPASPNISFALTGANQTITTTPVYYYLVMDANILPTATTTFEFDVNTVTSVNTTAYTDKTGTLYTLTAPTITENQTTGGLYTPTTVTGSQTNLPLSGISLVSVNGNIPVTAINYTATRNISTYFSGNVNLYKSTSATFSTGTATLVTSSAVPNSTNISFALTGANQTITSTPVYYYLVFDANIVPTTTTTFEMDVNTVTSAYTVNYTDKTGTSYTLNAPTVTVTQTTGGLYTPTTISGNQTNLPLSGVVLTSTNGNSTVTAINYTATQNISTYFSGNVNFYRSTSATFSTGTATLLTSTAVPNSTNISFAISAANQTVASGTPVYYYLVMDANIPPTASTTFEWDVNTITTPNTTAYTDKTGTSYTLSPAVTLGAATTTGLAANPLNYSQTGIGIYGFSVTTTASQTFNQFNFTATRTIGTYFSNVKLYSNTTNSFTTATPVSGVTVSNLNSTTLTLSGLSQTVNPGTPIYYFIVVDYTDPATATTFQLSVKNVITATTTYTNGTPVAGTVYNLGPVTYDWAGTAPNVGGLYPWTVAANWKVNGATSTTYPGQNGATADIANIGVNLTYTNQPNLAANVTIASMFFGYNGPQSTYQTTPNTLKRDNTTLTVGTGSTLTVTGNITKNHNPSAAGSNVNFSLTTLAGTGTIVCQSDLMVGDATQPGLTVAVITEISSQINQLTVNGNIILTSNGNAPQSVQGNRGLCYPYFSLDKGTTTLAKQFKFTTNALPIADLFDTYNQGITAFKGYGLVTCDKVANNPSTLELLNVQAIVPADLFYVSFTYGGNNGTVLYDDPNAADNQVIYVANEPSATTTQTYINTNNPAAYYNLSFAGPSTKVVDKNSTLTATGGTTVQGLTLAGAWTTDGGIVDLKTNDPTVIIAGAWNNTTTINHDAGTISVGGMFSNNVSGDASGTLNCGPATITFKGGYTNNATFVANTTGNINFIPTTAETITDNSTYGTIFNNVNFTSGTTTINPGLSTIGNIAVANVGKLKMSGTGKLVAGTTTSGGTGYLTLMSDAVSTATVYTPSGTSITGNVNVQRWITGGTGYRGYRLFSSPVNASLNAAGGGNLSLGYLGANGQFANNTYLGAFTEGPGTGFTYNGSYNPIIYLYDETRPSTNQGFTAGKNIGIYSITGNTVTTLTSGVQQANVSIPVGNSYLLYYVGDNHLTDQTAVLTSRIPESTPVTATGYLNQGNVVVSFWKSNSTTIPYDVNGGNLPGLNQVGNPYASTIKLSQFYSDNSSLSISPQFWVLDATTGLSGTYISYNATSGATSSTKSGNYVVSGQGFLVQATAAGSANLTFKEDQKVDYPAITSTSGAPNGALVMDVPSGPSVSKTDAIAKSFDIINPVATGVALTGLHLQLSKDSTYYTQTGIYFSTQWSDAYNLLEDAVDLDGATPKVYLSSYSSDGKRLSINELGDYAHGKRIKLYAGANSSGAYNISLADFMNIDTVNYKVYLIDRKMNDSLDLVHSKSYAFTINNSDTSTYGANRFVLAIEHAPVPQYLLTSFRGVKVKAGVQLIWTAMNASDYTGYILQKKDNKGNFNPLYTTQSVKGDNSYSYVDLNPIIGGNTYRLLQNDINGNITYSDTVTIKYNHLAQGFAGLAVFPNPSNSIINIVYANATSDTSIPNYTVDIFNSIGTFIKHETIKSNSWTEDISNYKLGVYVLQVKDNNGNLVGQTKFIRNL